MYDKFKIVKMTEPKKKELSREAILELKAAQISEMKERLPDLRIEEEYWRLTSSMSESRHKMYLLNKIKAEDGTDKSANSKKESK